MEGPPEGPMPARAPRRPPAAPIGGRRRIRKKIPATPNSLAKRRQRIRGSKLSEEAAVVWQAVITPPAAGPFAKASRKQ
eukprot:7593876-Lingulodinium_polyedra.AAC.1